VSGKEFTLGDARRIISALGRQVQMGDPEDLKVFTALAGHINAEMGKAVQALREHGYTDVQIGEQLGMTRQAVQQRWPRPAGSPVGAGARYVGC
jgi:electron transfer flavoprotein alpha subunit